LVFLDESGAKTNMTRLRGRAPRGERLLACQPHGHWQTTTMLAALRLDGSTACMTMEGATDTEVFRTFVQAVLGPMLRPGDVVVMDNLSPHKQDASLQLIEAVGATARFLPAYSPDLNPIEKMWSKVKELLRGAEARTGEALQAAIAAALACVTAQDARNWFASCGYCFI
jgi:transposase